MKTTMPIDDLRIELESQLSFIKHKNIEYSYSLRRGELNDRTFHFFRFDNKQHKKKIEIVYCEKVIESLQGFLIDYQEGEPSYLDFSRYIPFSRLRVFVDEMEIIFFGNEQYEIEYRVEEVVCVARQIEKILVSSDWVNLKELKEKELELFAVSYEYKMQKSREWIARLKKKIQDEDGLDVIYDSSTLPPHEAYGMRVKNMYSDVFQIGYGCFDTWEAGFVINVVRGNEVVSKEEILEHVGVDDEIINFCQQKTKVRSDC